MGIHFTIKNWHKATLFLIIAIAPSLTLLLRGTVWGADSFAFWTTMCGNITYINSLGTPTWLLNGLIYTINCNLYHLILIMFGFYLMCLIAFFVIGKHFFQNEGWRLPIYIGALTPLFFIEALRFENDFFGWTLAYIALSLFIIALNTNKQTTKAISIILMLITSILSIQIWLPSILILLIMPLFIKSKDYLIQPILLLTIIIGSLLNIKYLINSFNFNIAEEIPLIGLIFILHITPFWKTIPKKLKLYGSFLIILGLLKSKYMYIATPILLISLLNTQLIKGIQLKRTLFGIKQIPILYICSILIIGFIIMGYSLYPTTNDLNEIKKAIQLSKDTNLPIYNDWGEGWIFISQDYPTKYFASTPNPDWNNLKKPYLAWTTETLPNCQTIKNKLKKCT